MTAVAVLSLALGIGANTAIFSLIDTVMLEKLPAKNAASLVLLGDGVSSGSMDDEPFGNWGMFSYPVYKELESRNQVFSGLLAFLSYSDRMLIEINHEEPELTTPKLVPEITSPCSVFPRSLAARSDRKTIGPAPRPLRC